MGQCSLAATRIVPNDDNGKQAGAAAKASRCRRPCRSAPPARATTCSPLVCRPCPTTHQHMLLRPPNCRNTGQGRLRWGRHGQANPPSCLVIAAFGVESNGQDIRIPAPPEPKSAPNPPPLRASRHAPLQLLATAYDESALRCLTLPAASLWLSAPAVRLPARLAALRLPGRPLSK